jgi:hypothetical protein
MEKKYLTDEEELKYLKSKKFRKAFAKQVEKDTWGKGLPKIYMDKNENIVRHWKDGRIEIIKTKEEWKKEK